jgi:hypothetical protein
MDSKRSPKKITKVSLTDPSESHMRSIKAQNFTILFLAPPAELVK